MKLGLLDGIIFVGYFVSIIVFGLYIASRKGNRSAEGFFLASKKLPWYVVGSSFVAANISTEHFIGMVGWSFIYGMAIASWCWMNVFSFSMLIWIFLPFYMRGGITTMPEFLERRFNRTCCTIYAVVQIVGLVIALLGGVMFAGAKAINVFFPGIEVWVGVLILAIAAGTYTIYGGLLSTVWADFIQYCLLMVGGLVVSIYGLVNVGGLSNLFEMLPEKFIAFYPAHHERVPWTGLFGGILSVSLWYSCANQFMVQRCLGARTEWDGRMGVVMAGFSQAFLPLVIVIPGIIAFGLFSQQVSDADQSWPFLVRTFLPSGLVGLVLAGLGSAIMSTLSAITNSSATIFTFDVYRKFIQKDATPRQLHRIGRLSSGAALLTGGIIALIINANPGITVFGVIQTVFWYLAPPIAAAFLLGILFKRITAASATVGIILGFTIYTPLTIFGLFENSWAIRHLPFVAAFNIPWLQPYNNFMHHTLVVFILTLLTILVASKFTTPKSDSELEGLVWSRAALRGPKGAGKHGILSLTVWWAGMVALITVLYGITMYKSATVEWLEAEDLNHSISGGGSAQVQPKGSLSDFTLWTGKGQVQFEPGGPGSSIHFEIPVESPGVYEISAVVTRGPEYGRFRASINDSPTSITYPLTVLADVGGRQFEVRYATTEAYDSRRPSQNAAGSKPERNHDTIPSIAGDHVVQRLVLGSFSLVHDKNQISFTSVEDGNGSAIGIDQIILDARPKH